MESMQKLVNEALKREIDCGKRENFPQNTIVNR
jgi:hypothetical protein